MEITVKSAIEVSESLATYILSSYIHSNLGIDVKLEHYLKHVQTGKFSIADVYIPNRDTAIEVKSVAHGNAALKGVVQASMYKEQCENSLLFMQKPTRSKLVEGIENFAASHGVGVIFLDSVPSICDDHTVKEFMGGCPNAFNVWKRNRFSTTRQSIISNSSSKWTHNFLDTLDQIIKEHSDQMFEFCIKPDPEVEGFYNYYR